MNIIYHYVITNHISTPSTRTGYIDQPTSYAEPAQKCHPTAYQQILKNTSSNLNRARDSSVIPKKTQLVGFEKIFNTLVLLLMKSKIFIYICFTRYCKNEDEFQSFRISLTQQPVTCNVCPLLSSLYSSATPPPNYTHSLSASFFFFWILFKMKNWVFKNLVKYSD